MKIILLFSHFFCHVHVRSMIHRSGIVSHHMQIQCGALHTRHDIRWEVQITAMTNVIQFVLANEGGQRTRWKFEQPDLWTVVKFLLILWESREWASEEKIKTAGGLGRGATLQRYRPFRPWTALVFTFLWEQLLPLREFEKMLMNSNLLGEGGWEIRFVLLW